MDWGIGQYEKIALGLAPGAGVVVEEAGLRSGERVVDVGCGTGNAALLAAERGATVTGIDPADRLLAVARARAAERGLDVTWLRGDAGALPVADAGADVILSVFGVVFAPNAAAAAGEMARIAAPDGRIVLSAWIPDGPLADVMRARREAMAAAAQVPAATPFPWHDRDALARLLAPHGFDVTVAEHSLAFVALSPEAFVESELHDHPMWIATRSALEPLGTWAALARRATEILTDANEDPGAFRLTSRYVVALARRGRRPAASGSR